MVSRGMGLQLITANPPTLVAEVPSGFVTTRFQGPDATESGTLMTQVILTEPSTMTSVASISSSPSRVIFTVAPFWKLFPARFLIRTELSLWTPAGNMLVMEILSGEYPLSLDDSLLPLRTVK